MKTNKFWNRFLRVSGIATLLGPLPSMIAPVEGTKLTLKLDISQIDGLSAVLGHWGIMIVGIGILIYLSGSNLSIRKTTLWYAIAEKTYMVSGGLITLFNLPEVGMNFIPVIISDSIQIIGFLLYFYWEYKQNKVSEKELIYTSV